MPTPRGAAPGDVPGATRPWRRAAWAAKDAGWRVNHKRIHRLWIAEGLRVPYRKRKKPLRGIGVTMGAFCPIRPNVLWTLDFQFDQTSTGGRSSS